MDKKSSAKPQAPRAAAGQDQPQGHDMSGLSFEQAMAELEKITKALEDGKLSLSEALTAYQRGAALMRHGQEILNQVQQDIEVIEAGQAKTMDRSTLIAQAKE